MPEVLQMLPVACTVADYVRDQEALWVDSQEGRERVELGQLIKNGIIEVLSLQGDAESAHFIALASSPALDDGEAITGALAHSRGLIVATDDRAALSAFEMHIPPIRTCSTASLMKHWAECASVEPELLRAALIDIRHRAYFEPSSRDPLQGWWRAAAKT
jgi:hypothetical protein